MLVLQINNADRESHLKKYHTVYYKNHDTNHYTHLFNMVYPHIRGAGWVVEASRCIAYVLYYT